MPGLAGFISNSLGPSYEKALRAMIRSMIHEEFYNFGSFADAGCHVCVGWTAHKDSFDDCMPILNETKEIILIFSGEIFGIRDFVYRLSGKNHEFSKEGPAVLVHLYEDQGEDFVKELNGQFAGLIIDKRNKKVFLFNDRFGMHRIFYYQGHGSFYFSSEAKALLKVLPQTREFDPKGVAEFLCCGTTVSDHTLYRDIKVLPGGTLIEFEEGAKLRKRKYFYCSEWEEVMSVGQDEFAQGLIDLIGKIPQKYFAINKGSVGISLTGGLDSRIIMACLNASPGSLPCYTFGSLNRDTFDVKVGREVARLCRQNHRVIIAGTDLLNRLKEYLEKAVYLSDGYLGLSGAPELYVNTLAREIAPVRITGNWGSELFRGVRAFKFNEPIAHLLTDTVSENVVQAKERFQGTQAMNSTSYVALFQAPYQGFGRSSIERSQLVLRSPFLDNDIVQFLYKKPRHCDGFALCEYIIKQFNPVLLGIPTDRGFLGEGLAPVRILCRAWRQTLFKAEYLVSHGAPHWLVRLERVPEVSWLERRLLGRHKFYHLRHWLQNGLDSYIRTILIENIPSNLLEFIDPSIVKRLVCAHFQGKANYLREIDILSSFAIASNLFFKPNHE